MSKNPTQCECLTLDQLNEWINSPSAVNLDLADHIDRCPACQKRLSSLTDSAVVNQYHSATRRKGFRQAILGVPPDVEDLGSLGRFQLEACIGTGGMGVVYRGRDEELGRVVAIKVLTNLSNPTAIARFEREANSASQLEHPNIVPIYSSGRAEDGRPFLVMPLIDGVSLKKVLSERSLDARKSVQIVRDIALGLHAAHQRGLVHRDVKPANVLLEKGGLPAKLVDFGLVRGDDDQALTRTDIFCGTPEYMSPEQASNSQKVDAQSDVYSLGIVLYECLTGSVPFRGKPLDILVQHRFAEPVPPTRLNSAISRDLETICLKAIQKESSGRYDSCAQFAEDLQNFLQDRPILARPTGRVQKVWRWAKRNPGTAFLALAFPLSLAVGTLLSTWQWTVATRNFKDAQNHLRTAQENLAAVTELVVNKAKFAYKLHISSGSEREARDLYKQLASEVDQLAELRPDDAEIRLLRPTLYLSLAELEYKVGNTQESIGWYTQSERYRIQALTAETQSDVPISVDPKIVGANHPDSLHLLAATRILRGEAHHRAGSGDQALADYEMAKTLIDQRLKTDLPGVDDSWIRRNLTLVLVLEGHVWADQGNNAQALACYQAAFQNLDPEARAFPKTSKILEHEFRVLNEATYASTLRTSGVDHINAYVDHFLGRHLVSTATVSDAFPGQLAEGERLLQRALEIRRKISQQNPNYADWKRDVAMTLAELAKASGRLGKTDSAQENIEEAVDILSLLAEKSDCLEPNLRLAEALLVRGEMLRRDDGEAARRDFVHAHELCESVLQASPSWEACLKLKAVVRGEIDQLPRIDGTAPT